MVLPPNISKNPFNIAPHSVGFCFDPCCFIAQMTLGDSDGMIYYVIILSKFGITQSNSLVLMRLQLCISAKVSSYFVVR